MVPDDKAEHGAPHGGQGIMASAGGASVGMASPLKVLVLGSTGRLGAALARLYAGEFAVTAWGRRECDLLHPARAAEAIARHEFDVLINTSGITSVDYCETHEAECRATNAEAPAAIAGVCGQRGARLIQLSTDYVFEGRLRRPLTEDDATGPLNVYGRSKLAGERSVLEACPGALIARVSWLFGPDKPSFPDMIIQRAMTADHVEAVCDKWSCPTYADDLAVWLRLFFTVLPRQSGIVHLCNDGVCNWQEYGQQALDEVIRMGIPLKTDIVHGVSMRGFSPFIAERPEYTALDTKRFEHLTGLKPRHWQSALREYLVLKYGR